MTTQLSTVCVYCGSSRGTVPQYSLVATEFGRLLASRGLSLVYGGSRVGTMGDLADGALGAGGQVYGVTTEYLEVKEIGHSGLTSLQVMKTMHERKQEMIRLADAFVMLPGGLGTFDEFFEIFTWLQIGLETKPCAILNVDHYFDPLLAQLDNAVSAGFVREEHRALLVVDSDPESLIDRLTAWSLVVIDKWPD